jgi:uncharacterized protein YndB with AHSA1/START domain
VTTESLVLRLERVLDAPPERVYAAWTDPAVLRRWWAAQPDWTAADASTDVRVGGRYRLSMRDSDGGIRSVAGEYIEVEPPLRLKYSWAWDPHEGSEAPSSVTVVTVEFIAEGSGTRVVLEQRGFVSEPDRDSHDEGWRGCLDNLERRVIAAGAKREIGSPSRSGEGAR